MASPIPAHRAIAARLDALPAITLWTGPTPVDGLPRLRTALGDCPPLLVKRDDAIPFGFGGNKVRKLRLVAAQAKAEGADTLITCGGVQSNHARATAAVAARVGMQSVLVANGAPPANPTANALLDRLLGADVRYVATREERAPAMAAAAERARGDGHHPFIIPLGASIALGAAAFAQAIGELLTQIAPPAVIVHATSSGGTQAGLIAGCRLYGLDTRVIGISADDAAGDVQAVVRGLLVDLEDLLEAPRGLLSESSIEVDDRLVGGGYGVPTEASDEASRLGARTEALFLDHTYTAKAMAGLIARVRSGTLGDGPVLFWHTGGQVGLFA